MYDDFESRDIVVIAIAQEDKDLESHAKFLQHFKPSPRFEIVADLNRAETSKYGRTTTYLIDKEGVVQYQVVNNRPLGRSVEEMVRMVDALQFHEEHGEVCPAGWSSGDDGMKANAEGVASYLEKNAESL